MKTVEDLVNFLLNQNQALEVRIVYDGFDEDLNVFKVGNTLFFSNDYYEPYDYKLADVKFTTKEIK